MKKLILILGVIIMLFACQNNTSIEKAAQKLSHQKLVEILYTKEQQDKGFLTIDYRYWFLRQNGQIKIRIYFYNKAYIAQYQNPQIVIKFLDSQTQTIDTLVKELKIAIKPQSMQQAIITLTEFPSQTKSIIINIKSYLSNLYKLEY